MNTLQENINISFIHKVKERIIHDVKQKFSSYRLSCEIPVAFSTIWFFLSIIVCTISCFVPFDLNYYSSMSLLFSGMCFIMIFNINAQRLSLLKKIDKHLKHDEFEYKIFSMEKEFEQKFPSIFLLNKEEVQELFALNLTSEQLQHLNNIIQKKGSIHFKHLEQLSKLMTQEELDKQHKIKLIEENKQAQHKLEQFLSEHEVHNDFNVQQLQNKLKNDEILLTTEESMTLSSRL